MDFKRGVFVRVYDEEGDVGFRHTSTLALAVSFAAFTLVDWMFGFRAEGLPSEPFTRALLSVALAFVSEDGLSLSFDVFAAIVFGGAVVSRDGARVLGGLVLVGITTTVAVNQFMDVGVFGPPLGVVLGYVLARWPRMRWGGLMIDIDQPVWLGVLIGAAFAAAVLILEISGAPAEGHHMLASLLNLLAGGTWGALRRRSSLARMRSNVIPSDRDTRG